MSSLRDGSPLPRGPLSSRAGHLHTPMQAEWPGDSIADPGTVRSFQQKLDFLTSHMQTQLNEHRLAMHNTHQVFEQLLQDLPVLCDCFRQAFAVRESDETGEHPSASRIYNQIDPDRSVGILNILWHALSFTTRGNTKPLALNRPGRPPVFTGRIIALHGDFMELSRHGQEFPALLQHEVASLYVPADPSAPAVMRLKHGSGEEQYFHQIDAPRRFLLKTVEVICGGGFFHEQ